MNNTARNKNGINHSDILNLINFTFAFFQSDIRTQVHKLKDASSTLFIFLFATVSQV